MEEIKYQCAKCRELKPLLEFHKSQKHKDGHYPRCKICRARDSAAYYSRTHGVGIKLRVKVWREQNPECAKAYRREYYLRNKNISQ